MPEESAQKGTDEQATPVSFPWLMVALAAFFDIVGMIPIVNFFTELLAGLIIGLWQKNYVPATDPLISFFLAKVIDIFSLGILPSNIAVVVYAYIKKKAANQISNTVKTPVSLAAINNQ
jgi:hypothetical protein